MSEKPEERFECVFLEGQECRVLKVLTKFSERLREKEMELMKQYSNLVPPQLQSLVQQVSGSVRTLSAFSPFEVLSKFCQSCPKLRKEAGG
jgi:hypothetical protein